MKYIPAVTEMANDIYHVFYTTIRTVYPKYYPKEAVDFFIQLHNKEQIRKRIASEHIGVLTDGSTIVGTGCQPYHGSIRTARLSEAARRITDYGLFGT